MNPLDDTHQARHAVAPTRFQLAYHLPGGVALHPLVGQRRAGDLAPQLLERLAVVRPAAHSSMQAETLHIGPKRLVEVRLPGRRALHRQHLLPGAWAEGDPISTRRSLQGPARTGLVRIAVAASHVSQIFLFDQHPLTGEQLQRAGNCRCTPSCTGQCLSWLQSPQRSLSKPRAGMPHSRKASNSSSTNRGRSAAAAASVCAIRSLRAAAPPCTLERSQRIAWPKSTPRWRRRWGIGL